MTVNRPLLSVLAIPAILAVFAATYFAGSVLSPVACALFIIAMTWPLQRELELRLPQLLAMAIVVVVIAITFMVFASLVLWSFSRVGRTLAADAGRLQAVYDQTVTWLEGHGIAIAGIWSETFNTRWLIRAIQELTTRLNTTITFWLVVFVYVILGLIEVNATERRVRSMWGDSAAARILVDGAAESASKLRRYMLIRTWMSLATGVLVWAIAAVSGLQLAPEWGVIAFTLNYIPFIGSFIATVLPTMYALAQFGSWETALLIFICLNIAQFVIGSYIEPRMAGNALAISPFVVLFSVFLWAFLWGPFGAFIGVPITIAMMTLCAQHPSSCWVAELLGASGGPEAGAQQDRLSQ